MGGKYRLKLSIIAVLALHGAGCSRNNDDDEQRRQLLEASRRAQARQERIDKGRVRSPEGDLLPSDNKSAGYVLPRGFVLTRTLPHRWTYDANLPQNKVEEYFDKRLSAGHKSKKGDEVEWLRSVEKSDPNQVPGWVQVMPTPSKRAWTRIIVSEPEPPGPDLVPQMDQQKMQEILAERRKRAR